MVPFFPAGCIKKAYNAFSNPGKEKGTSRYSSINSIAENLFHLLPLDGVLTSRHKASINIPTKIESTKSIDRQQYGKAKTPHPHGWL